MTDNIRQPFYSEYNIGYQRPREYTNVNDMKLCEYCGFEYPGSSVQAIIIRRNGRERNSHRCKDCAMDIHFDRENQGR